jgi:hypothetical protein
MNEWERVMKLLIMQYLQPPVDSSLLDQNILFSTMLSNSPIQFYSFNVRGHVLHPHKTTGKICSVYVNPYKSSQSQSHIATDGQSVSKSWCRATSGAYDQIFFFCSEYGIRLTVTFFIPWDTLSDERTGLSFVCAAGLCQRSLSRL